MTVSSSTLLAGGTVKYRSFWFVVFVFVFCFLFFLKDDLVSGSD